LGYVYENPPGWCDHSRVIVEIGCRLGVRLELLKDLDNTFKIRLTKNTVQREAADDWKQLVAKRVADIPKFSALALSV